MSHMSVAEFAAANHLTRVEKMSFDGLDGDIIHLTDVFPLPEDFDTATFADAVGAVIIKDDSMERKKYNGLGFMIFSDNSGFDGRHSAWIAFENGLPIALKDLPDTEYH